MLPYARQSISEDDIAAVVRVLRSDFLTQGPEIEAFERAVAEKCDVPFAVAVSSATAGLHLAYQALGAGPGDEVWTSPNTFVATANAARYCGARPDFIDIDPRTYNLCPDRLAARLKAGGRPKIVAPVHFSGQPAALAPIATLSQEYGFAIVEDAAHAIGASYQNRPIGCCALSDCAVFSFHPVKIITTGEGGMILTRRKDLYDKLIRLRTHGITRNPALMTRNDGPWYYEQLELGSHYRLTDFQAALGRSQLKRLDEFITRRQQLANRYNQLLSDLPLTLPWQHPDGQSSWHLYVVRLKLDQIRKTHRQVFEELRAAGIGVNLHYIPVHLQPDYRALGFQPGMFPEAEAYYREALSLPMFASLTEAEQDQVVNALRHILKN
jgi:UDP-4-amino-4,6-dideoxy-N-acetyl-beta-L-altrosamine transaminase